MSLRSPRAMLLAATWLAGCECASANVADLDADASSSTVGGASAESSAATASTTGEPFDASRWIGRYHFEHAFLRLGERGTVYGWTSLVNFEILPDGRASMLYDDCSFEAPITIAYEWLPSEEEEGWVSLYPGVGETSLRFMDDEDVETLRVQLVEPCRELIFDVDGRAPGFLIVRPGASCWEDRCSTYHVIEVDYCEGEEPPACP